MNLVASLILLWPEQRRKPNTIINLVVMKNKVISRVMAIKNVYNY